MILKFMERLPRDADFLVIGGHPDIHHGYVRMTLDIDFFPPATDHSCWRDILEKFHYQPDNETSDFTQFAFII
ncbi:MAG: hypothetical protein WCQ57_11200 [Verrucomicrobiota bacterium]